MKRRRALWLESKSESIYARLLFLYPFGYRMRYRVRMLRTFRDCCHFALSDGGFQSWLRLWASTLGDLPVSVLDRHFEDGWLSTSLAPFRMVGVAAIVASAPLFVLGWGGAAINSVLAAGLFMAGVLGLVMTTSWFRELISKKGGMMDTDIRTKSVVWKRLPASARWATIALLGLTLFDLADVVLDVLRGAEYLGAQIAQNGQVGTAMVGLLPRIAMYGLAFWLYLRGAGGGRSVPRGISRRAVEMNSTNSAKAMRLIFSLEVAASILTAAAGSSIENPLVNVMAVLFALATLVTSIWAAVDLRRSESLS